MQRMIVAVVAVFGVATIFGNTDVRLSANVRHDAVTPTASIVESSDTVGLADSNLMRLRTEREISKQLDMMQSIGVQNIRIGLYWAEIEPTEGNFRWDKADYIIQQAYDRGMGVLAGINETPAWAGTPIGSGTPSTTDYSQYVTTLAQRYKGKISAYEIWNEPNANFFLDPVSPANYTALLKAGYSAIKAVDPSITVIGGVLGSGQTKTDDSGAIATMDPTEFLQGMYDAGAHGYFDALSFHPYKYDVKFSNQGLIADSPLRQLEEMLQLMQANGDGAKKIWASEYGLPTKVGAIPATTIDEQKQADFIADFLNTWSKQAGTGPMFIYTTRDINSGDGIEGDNFGIWKTDWTPKKAVQVLKDYIAKHSGPSNPILDWIKNVIVNGWNFVKNVITGVVDIAVGVAKVIAQAVVWAVKTAVNVTVNVIKGITNIAIDVVKGIGNLIRGAVHAVVNVIKNIFDGPNSAASAAAKRNSVAAAVAATGPASKPTAVAEKAAPVASSAAAAEAPAAKKASKARKPVAAATADATDGNANSGDKATPDVEQKPLTDKAAKPSRGKGKASDAKPTATETDSDATDSGAKGFGKRGDAGAVKKAKKSSSETKPKAAAASY